MDSSQVQESTSNMFNEFDSESELTKNSLENSEEENSEIFCGDEDTCESLYSLNLKEFELISYLTDLIPAKAQRGFDTYELNFTCIDASSDFLAIGTNIGTLYLYDRRDGTLKRIRYENYIGTVTAVSSVEQEKYLLAFGFDSGVIMAISISLNEPKIISQISVSGDHHGAVTSLEWSTDTPELFSGDNAGLVVYSRFDFDKNSQRSSPLIGEPCEIVQLSYLSRMLAVSTMKRTIVCQLIEDKDMRCHRVQVGRQERKKSGAFGTVFDMKTRNFQLPILYTSRPGIRLWKSNSRGEVIETMLLTHSLQKLPSQTIGLLPNVNANLGIHKVCPKEKPQIEKLKMFQGLFVLGWNGDGIFIVDPDIRIMIASCQGLQRIVDVSVCRDEIFVLQGDRCIRRIATSPEDALFPDRILKGNRQEDGFPFANILSPFQDIGSVLKAIPVPSSSSPKDIKTDQTDSPNAVFGWIKDKLKKPESKGTNMHEVKIGVVTELPPITDLNIHGLVEIAQEVNEGTNYSAGLINGNSSEGDFISEGCKFPSKMASEIEESEDLVFQPRKKKKSKEKLKKSSIENVPIQTVIIEQRFADTTTLLDVPIAKNSVQKEILVDSEVPMAKEPAPDITDVSINHQSKPELAASPQNDDERLAKILSLYSMSLTDSASNSFDIAKDLAVTDTPTETLHVNEESLPSIESEPNPLPNNEKDNSSEATNEMGNCDSDVYRLVWQISSASSYEPPTPDVDIYSQKQNTQTRSASSSFSLTQSDELSDSMDYMQVLTRPELGCDWIQHPTPGILVSLSVSQTVLYATTTKDELYYGVLKGPVLVWKNCNVQADLVSVSPMGRTISVLHKGTLKTSFLKRNGVPSTHFKYTAKNVISVAVDDDRVWYLTNEAQCYYQMSQESHLLLGDPQSLSSPTELKQLAAHYGLLWALSLSGKIYTRTGLSNSRPDGLDWVEVPFSQGNSPVCLALGADNTAWVIDSQGLLWVKNGVKIGCPIGASDWYQVEPHGRLITKQEYSTPKGMKKLLSPDNLASVFTGQPKPCFASNDKGSWFSDSTGQNLVSSRGDIIAQIWSPYQPNGCIASTKWSVIASSAWTNKEGLMWAVYSTGELFYITLSERKLVSVSLPDQINCKNKIVALAPIKNMLWILAENSSIYVLCNVTPSRPQGHYWKPYDDFQLDSIKLSQLSCSNNVIWATDDEGNVRCRVGPVQEPNELQPAWILIDEGQSNKLMSQVCVGPSPTMVWGIAGDGSVHVREGVSLDMPIGTSWSLLPGLYAINIALSSTTVWVITETGEIYWRYGIEPSNVGGDSWIRIPGSFRTLTASIDNELWALDKDGALHHLELLKISHNPGDTVHAKMKESFNIPEVEEDWEVV